MGFLTLIVITIVALVARMCFKPQEAELSENRKTYAERGKAKLGIKPWHVDNTEYDFLGKKNASRNELRNNEARHRVVRRSFPHLKKKDPKTETEPKTQNSNYALGIRVLAGSVCLVMAGLAYAYSNELYDQA